VIYLLTWPYLFIGITAVFLSDKEGVSGKKTQEQKKMGKRNHH